MHAEIPRTPGAQEPDPSRQHGYRRESKLSTAPMLSGLFAARRAGDGDMSLPATAEDVTARGLGIVIAPREWHLLTPFQYDAQDAVTYMRSGKVWVNVEAPVQEFDPVFSRFMPGPGGSQLGALRGDSDGGTCAKVNRAQFATDSSRHALVRIDL